MAVQLLLSQMHASSGIDGCSIIDSLKKQYNSTTLPLQDPAAVEHAVHETACAQL